MNSQFIMTLIGKDKPGIVESIAEIIANHGGNWEESKMCRLGGEFAGILRFSIPTSSKQKFLEAIPKIEARGLSIMIKDSSQKTQQQNQKSAKLEIIGTDRPGIIQHISHVLAVNNVNFEELESECISAPMSGNTIFKASANISIPKDSDINTLKNELEKLAEDLLVDINLTINC